MEPRQPFYDQATIAAIAMLFDISDQEARLFIAWTQSREGGLWARLKMDELHQGFPGEMPRTTREEDTP